MRFIDLTQRIKLQLTVGIAETLKAANLIDVFALPANPEAFTRVLTDPSVFVKTLWEMSDQSGMSYEHFQSLVQEADYDDLWSAFTQEITDFFRDPMEREIVAANIGLAERRWQMMLQQMLQAVSESSQSEAGEQSGNWPESSVLTLDHLPPDSSKTWLPEDSALTGVVVAA